MAFRSFVYNLLFFALTFTIMVVLSPALLLGRHGAMVIVRAWSRLMMALHRGLTGIGHDYRGFEKIPPGGCIVAVKHQSTWETIALIPHFSDPAFILKRELMWIPLFGWWAWVAKMIPVERGKGVAVLAGMTAKAREAIAEGRQILIFPEGTRREAGAPPAYKFGVAHLYRDLNCPIVPIALNSGSPWPRRSRVHRKGTIVAEVLDPVPPGLDPREAFARLESAIETACDRLLLEAATRGDDLPPPAAKRVAELRAGAGTRLTRAASAAGTANPNG
jgi:1-acyl-sn-glycerol-3-phosphate acyltransferase